MRETGNVWSDEGWFESDEEWAAGKSRWLPRGEKIGATVYEIAPERTGGYQLINRTEEPVRYLMVANRPSPEAVEYPDSRQLSVMAFTESQLGARLWDIRTLEEPEAE